METFEHLTIDAGDLMEALGERLETGFWALDLESGEILPAGQDPWGRGAETEDVDYDDPDRFRAIEPLPPHEAFGIMEAFVASLPDGEGQRALDRALGHARPFRSFKDTLEDFPRFREAWFKFRDDRMLEAAQEWIEENLPGAKLALD